MPIQTSLSLADTGDNGQDQEKSLWLDCNIAMQDVTGFCDKLSVCINTKKITLLNIELFQDKLDDLQTFFNALLQSFPKIECIEFSSSNKDITNFVMNRCSEFKCLKRINIELDFSVIPTNALKLFMDYLSKCDHVEHLDIKLQNLHHHSSNITAEEMTNSLQYFWSNLPKLNNLKELELTAYGMFDSMSVRDVQTLGEHCAKCTKLADITIRYQSLFRNRREKINAILGLFLEFPTLQRLDISHNELPIKYFLDFADILPKFSKLNTLIMIGMDKAHKTIDNDSALILRRFGDVICNSRITHLDISDNWIPSLETTRIKTHAERVNDKFKEFKDAVSGLKTYPNLRWFTNLKQCFYKFYEYIKCRFFTNQDYRQYDQVPTREQDIEPNDNYYHDVLTARKHDIELSTKQAKAFLFADNKSSVIPGGLPIELQSIVLQFSGNVHDFRRYQLDKEGRFSAEEEIGYAFGKPPLTMRSTRR